ncbi:MULTISPECIES: N-6 DNA methylase [Shewanella]|uniref:N-6 DNA methylase n=1 Tax=Shewanella TaxID=22 RepID=UPI00201AAA74|nr:MULTISPECIES: N-6 DNA methylase [Shewanella]MCT8874023.1 N-6 DNA methylase [Shewanella xiamenensis]UWH42135.1 N-6 DNA methylase [Shewanella xiamenensis]
MSTHSKAERKALGAYYTPNNLSQVLCDWAIRAPDEVVLEPSFGGCGFLETSVNTLRLLGCEAPNNQLYGADIDLKAFDFLFDKLGKIASISNRFICKDFIQTTTQDFGCVEFDVVIGNPPYVSMHNMSEHQRASCKKILRESPYADETIGSNASLWAFFLLHSLSFLKRNARVAWVLPSSVLHADYAKALLSIYKKHFESLKVIKLNQRFFQSSGADEISVVLLADGFNNQPRDSAIIQYSVAEDLSSLKEKVTVSSELQQIFPENYKYSLMTSAVITLMNRLEQSHLTQRMGEISNVVIGMVTGDNKKFVLSEKETNDLNLEQRDLRPVIGRFSQLKGIIHTPARHNRIVQEGHKCLLVCPENLQVKNSSVRSYLAKFDRNKRKTNRTFAKRVNWYYPDDGRYPDGFLSYMLDKGPRLVINTSKINCTNSIHRVFFTNNMSYAEKKAIAVSFLSSYSQLSAELVGRSYGSGVLKLEPTAAKNISIFTSTKVIKALSHITSKIDVLVAEGLLEEAQKIVDNVICKVENIPLSDFDELNKCAHMLRLDRYRGLSRGG